jgi:hypothetical protein
MSARASATVFVQKDAAADLLFLRPTKGPMRITLNQVLISYSKDLISLTSAVYGPTFSMFEILGA